MLMRLWAERLLRVLAVMLCVAPTLNSAPPVHGFYGGGPKPPRQGYVFRLSSYIYSIRRRHLSDQALSCHLGEPFPPMSASLPRAVHLDISSLR